MKKHNISSLEELSEKSKNNLEWFWESVDKDIGIIWDEPYTKTLDSSNGIAWSKWFVNGKTNIYKSSVEKFTNLTPEPHASTSRMCANAMPLTNATRDMTQQTNTAACEVRAPQQRERRNSDGSSPMKKNGHPNKQDHFR